MTIGLKDDATRDRAWRIWAIQLLLLFLTVSPVHAAALTANTPLPNPARPILTAAYVEFPPLEYMDENGQPAGIFVDLTRQVADEAGYDLEFVYLPISRTYFYLRNGMVDLWLGLTDIPALNGYVLESDVSPIATKLSVWSLEETPAITRFENFNDRILILISGYTYGGLLYHLEDSPSIRVTYAPNHLAALKMLERNRGHYLLDYQFPVRETLHEEPVENIREQPVRTRFTAWLFSRQTTNHQVLRDRFDQAYRRLAEQGKVPTEQDKSGSYTLLGLPLGP